jgi:DNA-binding IclR family transcriptional regulator
MIGDVQAKAELFAALKMVRGDESLPVGPLAAVCRLSRRRAQRLLAAMWEVEVLRRGRATHYRFRRALRGSR